MRMMQCPRRLGLLWQSGRKETRGALTLEGEMERLEVVGLLSGTEGGSVDPKRDGALVSSENDYERRKRKTERS